MNKRLPYFAYLLLSLPLLPIAALAGGVDADPAVVARAGQAWEVAAGQMQRTLDYLEAIEPAGIYYPQQTENEALEDRAAYADGEWQVSKAGGGTFWARGAFPGILWLLASREADPVARAALEDAARTWSTPLFGTTSGDMAMNSLFALRPWYHAARDAAERQLVTDSLLGGAALLAEPYDRATATGRFHLDIGVMGYSREANDGIRYFQAFVDHSVNVEQLLWAARVNPDPAQAQDWRAKALSHIAVLGSTFGPNRNPGSSGTWQRGYFDWEESSPTYGAFLFNEAKQGYGDATTWSRGQAWYVYGASVAYAYSFDQSLLPVIKEQVDYFLAHLPDRFPGSLRRPGKMIPPWDFDYALAGNSEPLEPDYGPQPDTEVDTSAASMALAGILQLVAALPSTDPDRSRYLDDAEAILDELCSETYLCDGADPEMSILRHGCYHHHQAVVSSSSYDNGLIWGDYFFVQALWTYLQLAAADPAALAGLEILSDGQFGLLTRYERAAGSLPFGIQFELSPDLLQWERVSPALEKVTPQFDGMETVELPLEPVSAGAGGRGFVRLSR